MLIKPTGTSIHHTVQQNTVLKNKEKRSKMFIDRAYETNLTYLRIY
jgi:hypothetical protein